MKAVSANRYRMGILGLGGGEWGDPLLLLSGDKRDCDTVLEARLQSLCYNAGPLC